MNAPRLPLDRVAAVLPLLASPHDGEALAACRALVRILDAAGFSLHDLADLIRAGGVPDAVVIVGELLELRAELTETELRFVAGCDQHQRRKGWLSDRQREVLERIRAQVMARREVAA
jgi:hypothetical protein